MNEPRWRTLGGYKRIREQAAAGKAWDVSGDGDTATVRVPNTSGKLTDVAFQFQQDDEFLEKVRQLKENPPSVEPNQGVDDENRPLSSLEQVTLWVLEGKISIDTLPKSAYRRFRRPPKRDSDVENQTVTYPVGPEYFAKLRVSIDSGEQALILAAETIAKHFLRQ